MPIYEYQCTNCNHHFDLLQKMQEEPTKQCPECGQETAIRLVSAAGFQLKGSGWYETDFKNKDKQLKPAESKSEKSSETPTAKVESAKSAESTGSKKQGAKE